MNKTDDYIGLCIGSGAWVHPKCANLDYVSDTYSERQQRVDFPCNLFTDSFPVPDGQYEFAYISHVIEHLSDRAAEHTLRESHRILKSGGYLRIICPDFDKISDAFFRRDALFFSRFGFARSHPEESIAQRFVRCFAAGRVKKSKYEGLAKFTDVEIEALFEKRDTAFQVAQDLVSEIPENYNGFSPSTHMNVWNADKLTALVRAVGFSNVYVSWYMGSRCEHMTDKKFFDKTHPFMSLYVEAQKHG